VSISAVAAMTKKFATRSALLLPPVLL